GSRVSCPKPSGAGHCAELCGSDGSCPKGEKCCSNGCGHQCMRVSGGEFNACVRSEPWLPGPEGRGRGVCV
ncbi:WAP four-disulfide core domain 18, partial [Chelydra serpentina]